MSKYYFQSGDESCYPLAYHRQCMDDWGLQELTVFEAKVERGTGYFFCKEFSDVGEVGEGCGKGCSKYTPRNGKNGICKHYGNVYEQTDIAYKITAPNNLTTPN